MDEKKSISFEEAMEKLEEIVEALEEGELPLETSIAKYKEGMDMAKICHEILQKAEKHLAEILKENGETEIFTVHEEE